MPMTAHFLRSFAVAAVTTMCLLFAPASDAKGKKKKAKPPTVVLQIEGLDAKTKKAKVRKLKRAVHKVKGVKRTRVKKKAGTLAIWHKKKTDMAKVTAAVEKAGFKVKADEAKTSNVKPVAEAEKPLEPKAAEPAPADEDEAEE